MTIHILEMKERRKGYIGWKLYGKCGKEGNELRDVYNKKDGMV